MDLEEPYVLKLIEGEETAPKQDLIVEPLFA